MNTFFSPPAPPPPPPPALATQSSLARSETSPLCTAFGICSSARAPQSRCPRHSFRAEQSRAGREPRTEIPWVWLPQSGAQVTRRAGREKNKQRSPSMPIFGDGWPLSRRSALSGSGTMHTYCPSRPKDGGRGEIVSAGGSPDFDR